MGRGGCGGRGLGSRSPWTALVVCATVLAIGAPGAHAARPALKIKRLQAPATIVAGESLRLRLVGVARTRRVRVTFHLSKDRRLGKGDVRLGKRVVRRAGRGRRVRRTLTLQVPERLPAGRRLRVLACTSPRRCAVASRAASVHRGGALPRTPAPLDVRPVLEPANAATKVLGRSGGTLEATAGDGTTFRLEMPADALHGTERITMTPIARIDGLPLRGGLVGAVDLQPDGLVLMREAKLTITPKTPVPVREQTAFKFHAGGEDLHEVAFAPGAELVLPLSHFSSPGVGRGTDAERRAMADRFPRRSRSQYEQLVSNALNRARADELGGRKGSGALDDGRAFVRAWWRDVMRPALIAAEGDDRLFERTLADVLGFVRLLQLLDADDGRFDDLLAEADERLIRAARNAVQRSGERCIRFSRIDEAQRLLRLALFAAKAQPPIDLGEPERLVDRCLRFELEFDATYVRTEESHVRWTSRVRGRGPLRFGPLGNALRISGDVPAESVVWQAETLGEGCQYSALPASMRAPMHVIDLGLDVGLVQVGEDIPPPPALEVVTALELQFTQALMDEPARITCGNTSNELPVNVHSTGFQAAHTAELRLEPPDNVGYFMGGWQPADGVFAQRRSVQRIVDGSVVLDEDLAIRLRHTPDA